MMSRKRIELEFDKFDFTYYLLPTLHVLLWNGTKGTGNVELEIGISFWKYVAVVNILIKEGFEL